MNNESVRQQAAIVGTPLSPEDAVRLVCNICEIVRERVPELLGSVVSLTRIFDMGMVVYEESEYSETWGMAVEAYLESKSHLRPSSQQENRYVMRRVLRMAPERAGRRICQIQPRECQELIERAFATDASRCRARKILHCFFNFALRHNWCRNNPIDNIPLLARREETIHILTLAQVDALLHTAVREEFRNCAAAVAIMLWAGIRPMEVARLHWRDVDLKDRTITVMSRVSKTGGARLVSIEPVLKRWLKRSYPVHGANLYIVPPNWGRRWKALRRAAGLEPWQPDTLRHTFASYHLRHFRDIYRLQVEMGHSNARMLMNRYLNMRGLTREAAAAFWGKGEQEE